MSKNKHPELKQELKDRQAASQAIRQKIHATSDMERWELWNEKREYGSTTRLLLLGYAFLRGVPYLACEAKTRRPVSAKGIAHVLSQRGIEADDAAVKAWLQTAPEGAQEAA